MSVDKDAFPFRTLRAIGSFLIIFGIVVLAAGIFNVTWSVVKYTDRYETCESADFTNAGLESPCENDELNWTWAGSGIWGGAIIILIGTMGAMFSRYRTRRLAFRRDMFAVTCILLVIITCPAVIAVSVLEVYYQDGIFYKWNTDDNSFDNVEDVGKLIAPLVVAGAALLAWVVAIAGACVGCCCADVIEKPKKYYPPPQPAFQPPPLQPLPGPMPGVGQPTVELVGILPPYGPPPPPGLFGPDPMGPPALTYY